MDPLRANNISLKKLDQDLENLFNRSIISNSYKGLLLSYLPKLLAVSDEIIAKNWLFDVYWDASHTAGISSIRATKYISMLNI